MSKRQRKWVFLSVLWLFSVVVFLLMRSRYDEYWFGENLVELLVVGIAPLLLGWGIAWVRGAEEPTLK
ncbi:MULTISPECIES: hypothetical protein [Aeromonas]|uniref:Uncharacterized protein n=1 Tax=Aeromonas bestiarum TaxID=105751 RepID=A0AAW7HZJ7_9GAMM|nr:MULTISPECIES: hypothetical protein [Aeromonas]MCH7346971.1 hypothetical protein [Aeromonas sp. MR7]MDM5140474.1 hypothetical protein [Aeromonas bestiarum]HDO1318016.1 hypothetical protein [Aeromonas veronii]